MYGHNYYEVKVNILFESCNFYILLNTCFIKNILPLPILQNHILPNIFIWGYNKKTSDRYTTRLL